MNISKKMVDKILSFFSIMTLLPVVLGCNNIAFNETSVQKNAANTVFFRAEENTDVRTSGLDGSLSNTDILQAQIPRVHVPKAREKSVVLLGKARFTLLTSQLIRMEYSENEVFEDRASLTFINRALDTPVFEQSYENDWLVIRTEDLTLRYLPNTGQFGANNLSITFYLDGRKEVWFPGMDNPNNLKGTIRTLDGFEGDFKAEDKSYVQLEQGLISRDGWSLINDSDNLLFEQTGNCQDCEPWLAQTKHLSQQDWYLFAYGHNYKKALSDFTLIAGKIPMPPRYALGYWWSRYWTYSDAELRELVSDIKGYQIPLDVLIIDMDWHETYGLTSKSPEKTPFDGMLGWTGYSWNKTLFPEPVQFLEWTENENLKVALNLHPADGVAPFEDQYQQMVSDLINPVLKDEWIEYQLSDKEWAKAYFDKVLLPLEQQGVDFWWLDWQQWSESKFVSGLNNTFWLNHVFFNKMKKQQPNKRPLLFHRWGGLGNHRYQVGFSGDAVISWKSLAYQPYFTATSSNVGYGYWSHDIGGHIAKYKELSKDGELYLRWLQYGVLSPIFRTHSSKSDVAERRIWRYPEYYEQMRTAIEWRYKLAPYIYNAARKTYDTGVSMTRPMYYDYPKIEQAYQHKQQYMLSDDLIVAPITSPVDKQTQLAKQTIWLPEGKWYEWDSGSLLSGQQVYQRKFSLSETPMYFKAGSIIPMYFEATNLQNATNLLQLTFIPGGDGQLNYYQDDGDSQAYQTGDASWTHVSSRQINNSQQISIGPSKGSFNGMAKKRDYRLVLAQRLPAQKVTVNGQVLDISLIHYDASKLSQIIELKDHDIDKPLIITIDSPILDNKTHRLLNTKVGLFNRLKTMTGRLKLMSARSDWGATIPNNILQLTETPSHIQYNLEQILSLLTRFDDGLYELEENIAKMKQITPAEAAQLVSFLAMDVTKASHIKDVNINASE